MPARFRPEPILVNPGFGGPFASIKVATGRATRPEHGLLIGKRLYDSIGGHPKGDDAEASLLRRIGRRRIALLACLLAAPIFQSD